MRDMFGIKIADRELGVGGVTPFQGLPSLAYRTQGVALGCGVDAPLARKRPRTKDDQLVRPGHSRTKGAQPMSPGQRPGLPIPPEIQALKGRDSSMGDHFVDANKMVESVHPEARELEERIAENDTEILETA